MMILLTHIHPHHVPHYSSKAPLSLSSLHTYSSPISSFKPYKTMAKMSILLLLIPLIYLVQICYGQGVVPGVMIFGDSIVDTGNNNDRLTLVKADFPPYGRDFTTHSPTGRFCNGKLATDFTIENLGFTSYPPAYNSKEARGANLLIGANFASGASGYSETTSLLYDAISLPEQLNNFKQYQHKIRKIAGAKNASGIISGSIYLLSAGSSDYLQNYYINPVFRTLYTPETFGDLLIESFNLFIKNLYGLGARRIGVTSLPPLGCLPASITLFGFGIENDCIESLNEVAINFNNKLNSSAVELSKTHPDLKLVIFDIYNPLLDLIKNPTDNGFSESRRACCGTGMIETSFLCNRISPGTCKNATGYIFWDSFHPTESANRALAEKLLMQGFALVS